MDIRMLFMCNRASKLITRIMDKKTQIIHIIIIMATLSIAAWNMRSATYAGPFLHQLCASHDIIVASEHRMYEQEFYELEELFPGYDICAKSSHDLTNEDRIWKPGHCGICLAWKRSLSSNVKIVKTESDRICAIQISNVGRNENNVYVIGVYLPQRGSKISDCYNIRGCNKNM